VGTARSQLPSGGTRKQLSPTTSYRSERAAARLVVKALPRPNMQEATCSRLS